MTSVMPDPMGRVIRTVETSAGLDVLLWLGSVSAWVGLLGWVIFAGPVGEVDVRAQAIARLWPLIGVWVAGLVFRSSGTGKQKRDLIAAYGVLESGRLHERWRAMRDTITYPTPEG